MTLAGTLSTVRKLTHRARRFTELSSQVQRGTLDTIQQRKEVWRTLARPRMSISTGNLRRKINIIPDQWSARGDVYYGSATYIVGVYSIMRILPVTHYAGNTVIARFQAICVKARKVTDDEGCGRGWHAGRGLGNR